VTSQDTQLEVQIEDVLRPDERRLLELQLLHHFVSVVSFTFPLSNLYAARELWTIFAVNLSFQQPVLLNAIFAITTLHLLNGASIASRFFAEDDDQGAIARLMHIQTRLNCQVPPAMLHSMYLSLAIRQQRDAVASQKIDDPDITNAIFLSTVLLSYQALGLASQRTEKIHQAYIPPTQWLRMVHGITSAAQMVNAVASSTSSPTSPGFSLVQFLAEQGGAPDFRDEAAIFHPSHREPFQPLLDWANYPEPLSHDESYVDVYEKTLSYVGGLYRGMLDRESPRALFRRVLCFGIKVPTEFSAFVEQGRPRAIAILAHHCAMAYCVNDHWIFDGFAEREVEGLGSLLPLEWHWAMEWPIAMIASMKERDCSS
jgi:hypothetical protein